MSIGHEMCRKSCKWLYRQTIIELDGSVMRSKWLDADRVALWLHAVLIQERRVLATKLERIHSVAPAGRVTTLFDTTARAL